jgi:hypothetical protein
MSTAVAKASRLKPEIRLAQAVSQFEADLSVSEKRTLQAQKSLLQSSPPDQNDVMRLTSEIDKTSGIVAGRRCFGPRLMNFLQAVQQFAALGDVVIGGSQNLVACGVWMLIRMSLLVSIVPTCQLDDHKLTSGVNRHLLVISGQDFQPVHGYRSFRSPLPNNSHALSPIETITGRSF